MLRFELVQSSKFKVQKMTETKTETKQAKPEIFDFSTTEDYKFWKDLGLDLCPVCSSKPMTGDGNELICPNNQGECDGVKLWKSKRK